MLHIITGPPCAGKSSYAWEHREPGDVVVDFDRIARASGADREHAARGAIKDAAFAARDAIIDHVLAHDVEALVIHTSPSAEQMARYMEAGADVVTIDADMETCLARAEQDDRPPETIEVIRRYFDNDQKEARVPQFKATGTATADAEHGIIEGYASTFDRIPDSYGDVIAAGAFAKSLKRWEELGKPIPLLYGHVTDDPAYNIGKVVEAHEDERGLFIRAEFDASEKAQRVRELVQDGRIFQFSFAFEVLDAATVKLDDGTRANELRELDIFEVSVVQIPANQYAVVTAIKDAEPETKSGRRNSAKDANALMEALANVESAAQIISDLLGEQVADDNEQEAEQPDEVQANAEEPEKAKAEEPGIEEERKAAALAAIGKYID